jgi:hypothetical protein
MKRDPSGDHTLKEEPPSETERNTGVLTAGVIALVVMATAIYWVT